MYVMYIRRVYGRALTKLFAQSDGFAFSLSKSEEEEFEL